MRLFQALVVQRSRAYVRKSQLAAGAKATTFPVREPPKVAEYELKKTYGKLLDMVESAFENESPLFSLPIYYPLNYWIGPKEKAAAQKFAEGRQGQVVGLIRTAFLKRFESSVDAFTNSCVNLLRQVLAWVEVHSVTPQREEALRRLAERSTSTSSARSTATRRSSTTPTPTTTSTSSRPRCSTTSSGSTAPSTTCRRCCTECYSDLNQLADFLKEAAPVQAVARRQAQDADQAAEDRPGAQAAQGA